MTAQAGKDFILSVLSGTYQQLGGLRSTSFTLNAEEIDITNIDSSQWKTLLDGAGIRSMSISGSGIMTNDSLVGVVRDACLNQTLTSFKITDEDGNSWSASFKVISFELAGEYNGAETYNVSLSSSGTVTYTAA